MERMRNFSKAERRERGRLTRRDFPRSELANWDPKRRIADPIAVLDETNADRIPGLLRVRYGRMTESSFAFFRGTAILQARDLAAFASSNLNIQACGDCHLMNFGGFATPERSLVFDINDFDETFPAPWEWDVKRLAASIVVASRYKSFSTGAAEKAVRSALDAYSGRMAEYADMDTMDLWYKQIRIEDLIDHFGDDKDAVERLTAAAKKALTRTSEAVLPKLTTVVNGEHRIVDNPPLIYHFHRTTPEAWESEVQGFFEQYKQTLQADRRALLDRYRLADTALKVVGVGSVGTRCFVSLLFADDDPLFLQTKEARRSVLESPAGKSRFAHQGERVVNGQRLMQAASDIFLGWLRAANGREYYVRQLRDMKVAAEIETFRPPTMAFYADMCGWALARAHAKAGGAAEVAGYIGKGEQFADALVRYAFAYADQVEHDFEAFTKAVRSGHLHTDTDESDSLDFTL